MKNRQEFIIEGFVETVERNQRYMTLLIGLVYDIIRN